MGPACASCKEPKKADKLMPCYRQDSIFDASEFAGRFPDSAVTS